VVSARFGGCLGRVLGEWSQLVDQMQRLGLRLTGCLYFGNVLMCEYLDVGA
jgi:hypothetical protein